MSSSFLPSCQPFKTGADLSLTFEMSWDRKSQLIGVSTLCQLSSWEVLVFSGSFATFSSSWLLTPIRWPGFPREGIKLFGVMLVALMSLKCCLVSVGHFPHMHMGTPRTFPLLSIPRPSIKWEPFKPYLVRNHLATVKSSETPGLHFLPSVTLCQPLPSSCLALPGFGSLRILQLKW